MPTSNNPCIRRRPSVAGYSLRELRAALCPAPAAAPLISEVALNAALICKGDKLFYIDAANCAPWAVTEVFDNGFEGFDGYETRDFFFKELQIGWKISDSTKRYHIESDRFAYATR